MFGSRIILPALENRKARWSHKIPASIVFELRRKVIHIVGAVAAVPVLLLVPLSISTVLALVAMGLIGGTYLLAERGDRPENALHRQVHDRVNGLLETTRREDEGFPWASVLFLASLLGIAWFSAEASVPLSYAFAAYGILGMGDAGSALIGVAYGRTPLPWNPRKSLQGTTAGLVTAFLAAVLLSLVFYAYRGVAFPLPMFAVAAVGSVGGMLAESLPGLEDNMVVPLAAMGSMVGFAFLVGLL